jgi:hypothetical protein
LSDLAVCVEAGGTGTPSEERAAKGIVAQASREGKHASQLLAGAKVGGQRQGTVEAHVDAITGERRLRQIVGLCGITKLVDKVVEGRPAPQIVKGIDAASRVAHHRAREAGVVRLGH